MSAIDHREAQEATEGIRRPGRPRGGVLCAILDHQLASIVSTQHHRLHVGWRESLKYNVVVLMEHLSMVHLSICK